MGTPTSPGNWLAAESMASLGWLANSWCMPAGLKPNQWGCGLNSDKIGIAIYTSVKVRYIFAGA